MDATKRNNQQTQGEIKLSDQFIDNDQPISDPQEIAQKFNFVNVGPSLADKIPASVEKFTSYLTDQ